MECWGYVLSGDWATHLSALLQSSSTPILRAAGSFGSGGLGSMVKYIGFLALHAQAEPVKREVENGRGIKS
jgi:hypothetical protein